MYYYAVAKIGSGTQDDYFRPNVPNGTRYVANESTDGTMFLVATSTEIAGYTPVVDLQGTCATLGISYSDVLTWAVG